MTGMYYVDTWTLRDSAGLKVKGFWGRRHSIRCSGSFGGCDQTFMGLCKGYSMAVIKA